MANDPYDLERFVIAQNPVYDDVVAELRAGSKESHWMWFVFPQLRGLGSSSMANRYGISSREEAEAYLQHPILGARLRECTRLVNQVEGRSVEQIFGYPDDLKFRSSMTLFAQAASGNEGFLQAIEKYFGGKPDQRTLNLLERM
jgi:uncharacterized protein (DUF1810 family)